MQEPHPPVGQPWLSRTEVELELARIALKVMRAAPDAFNDTLAAQAGDSHPTLAELCDALLARTSPDHRAFVEGRLRELARCLAGSGGEAAHAGLQVHWSGPAPSGHETGPGHSGPR